MSQIQTIDAFSEMPFPADPELLAIVVAYQNRNLIGAEVLPIVNVQQEKFRYDEYGEGTHYTIPNVAVGPKGKVNELQTDATEKLGKTNDYGLLERIPQGDLDAAGERFNLTGRSTERLTNLVMLAHEVRCSQKVFNADSYATGLKTALAGSDQWSHADSDPVKAILTALDAPLMRPNIAVLGQEVWTVLRQHPKVVKATNGNSGDAGAAARAAVAELFELEEILVGSSRLNTSKNPGSATLTRAWGKHAAFVYRDRTADTNGGITFGYTAMYGDWLAGQRPGNFGLRGGVEVLVGHSVTEVIAAPKAGYYFATAVA